MKQRSVKIVLGQNGCGKSWLCGQEVKAHSRVLVCDAGYRDYAVEYADTFPELIDRLEKYNAFGTFRPFRLGYKFKPHEYDLFFQTGKELKNVLLVGEEAHRFVIEELPHYAEAILEGRHHGVSMIMNSPAPVDLPTDLRRACTHFVSFRQIMPSDLDWISKIVGDAAYSLKDIAGPDVDDEKITPPFPSLRWRSGRGAEWDIPAKWAASHKFLNVKP